tara:strand:+ start:6261 stop:8486 length:2226 start_codon:yes stop_codon:yes gene_type:complete
MNIAESFSTALQAGNMAQQQADMQAANKIKLLQGMMTSLAQGMEGTGAMAQGVTGAAVRARADMREQQIFNESEEARQSANELLTASNQNRLSIEEAIRKLNLNEDQSIAKATALAQLSDLYRQKTVSDVENENYRALKKLDQEKLELQNQLLSFERDARKRDSDAKNKIYSVDFDGDGKIGGDEEVNFYEFQLRLQAAQGGDKLKLASKQIEAIGQEIQASKDRIAEQQKLTTANVKDINARADATQANIDLLKSQSNLLELEWDIAKDTLKDPSGKLKTGEELTAALEDFAVYRSQFKGQKSELTDILVERMGVFQEADAAYQAALSDGEEDKARELNRKRMDVWNTTATLVSSISQDGNVALNRALSYQTYLESVANQKEMFPNRDIEIMSPTDFNMLMQYGSQSQRSSVRSFIPTNSLDLTSAHNQDRTTFNARHSDIRDLHTHLNNGAFEGNDQNRQDAVAQIIAKQDLNGVRQVFDAFQMQVNDSSLKLLVDRVKEMDTQGVKVAQGLILDAVLSELSVKTAKDLLLKGGFNMGIHKQLMMDATGFTKQDIDRTIQNKMTILEKKYPLNWLKDSDILENYDDDDDAITVKQYHVLKKMRDSTPTPINPSLRSPILGPKGTDTINSGWKKAFRDAKKWGKSGASVGGQSDTQEPTPGQAMWNKQLGLNHKQLYDINKYKGADDILLRGIEKYNNIMSKNPVSRTDEDKKSLDLLKAVIDEAELEPNTPSQGTQEAQ